MHNILCLQRVHDCLNLKYFMLPQITRVEKIYNPQIYGMYLISKKELLTNNPNYNVEEKMLYHATSEDNAINISKNNIDWRMTRRSRFGIGNCFSPCPVYAHRHASRRGGMSMNITFSIILIINIFFFYRITNFYFSFHCV